MHLLVFSHWEDFDAIVKTFDSSTVNVSKALWFLLQTLLEKLKPVVTEEFEFRNRNQSALKTISDFSHNRDSLATIRIGFAILSHSASVKIQVEVLMEEFSV